MAAHLVTGYAGKPHVTAADIGLFNTGVLGTGKYVLNTGEKFAWSFLNSNELKISPGDLVNQGRHISIAQNEPITLTLDNGESGKARIDLVIMKYRKDPDTAIETAELMIVKGMSVPNTQTPQAPATVSGDIVNGAMEDDFVLYEIVYNGISITKVNTKYHIIHELSSIPTIRYGDSAPSDTLGVDGDIYFKLM